MAKNDYYVIAGYILSYLYACLKEGKTPEESFLSLAAYPADIPESYRDYVYIQLEKSGYVTGLMWGEVATIEIPKTPILKSFKNAQITPEGIRYLQNDKSIGKALEVVKNYGSFVLSAISAFK